LKIKETLGDKYQSAAGGGQAFQSAWEEAVERALEDKNE